MTYRGRVQGGIVVLAPDAQILDGTLVNVEFVPIPATLGEHDDDPMFRIGELAVDCGIADLSTNIDHYLYGHPKVDDAG